MREDEIWKVFKETGEPACYLLYRLIAAEDSIDNRQARSPAAG